MRMLDFRDGEVNFGYAKIRDRLYARQAKKADFRRKTNLPRLIFGIIYGHVPVSGM